MKLMLHDVGVRLAVILAMAALSAGTVVAAEDVNAVFQMGRTAYQKGDLELAHQLLSQVEARDPRHQETKILLATIRASLKKESSLKRRYEVVRLAKIEFTDLTFEEALDGLRALSKLATNGQMVPNFIVKDPALNAKKISLNLKDVPLAQAIQYVAELAGAKATYDQHAVMFTGAAG